MEEMDRRRIERFKSLVLQMVNIESKTLNDNDTCLQNTKLFCEKINPEKDSLIFAERYKTGQTYPSDIPFEGYQVNLCSFFCFFFYF